VDKDAVKSGLVRNSLNRPEPVFLPQAEFNENDPVNMTGAFLTNKLPVHEPQAEIIINQGLDTDRVRGAISSSSMRDAPSKVFGISTPFMFIIPGPDDIISPINGFSLPISGIKMFPYISSVLSVCLITTLLCNGIIFIL
jgi:hypothetical protein